MTEDIEKYRPKTGRVIKESGEVVNIVDLLTQGADWYTQVALGNIPGYSIIHKFGASLLDTTIHPLTQSTFYRVPITNTALEFVSSSANDSANGSGAQEITIIGSVEIDGDWVEVTQTLETNGLTPVSLDIDLIRLPRWYVSRSGTYATATAGSHQGTLTIREAGAGAIWSSVVLTPFPNGQSQIGVYTIPSGKIGYLISKDIFVATTKVADIYFFQRPLANDVTPPYTGIMRLVEREIGVVGGYPYQPKAPKGPFVGPCDVGFMGVVSVGTAECSVEFELLLIDV